MTDASSEQIESWLLALLRYVITRREADRAAAELIAGAMDAAGERCGTPAFDFFRRTSGAFCTAIAQADIEASDEIGGFLKRIDAPRLRAAFEAALGRKSPGKRPTTEKAPRAWLWKGLEAQGHCPSETE